MSDEQAFWLCLLPYAALASMLALGHALIVKWLLAPLPTLADYTSQGIAVVWILMAAWYGDAIIRAVARWERNRA